MPVLTGVLPGSLLVHVATPVSYQEPQSDPPEWVEGEPGPQGGGVATEGTPFACVLFMPSPGGEQQNAYRPKVVRVPTLLYNPQRDDGSAVVVGREDELLISAPELAPWTGATVARWLTVGDPQPFGPPGVVYGLMATLRSVRD